MIRPFTCLCFLLACASGLYLYQSKHRAQMLDREIERTVHATEATHDQSRLLNAEWMLLNDPERLRALADQLLTLRTVTPAQFTTMADLDQRLPPVRGPDAPLEPVPEPAVMTPMIPPPVAQANQPQAPGATPASMTEPMPPPAQAPPVRTVPHPAPTPSVQTVPHPVPPPLIAERKPAPERPTTPPVRRVAAALPEPHPAEPRPASVAHGPLLAAAAPRPMPVSAPRFSAPIAPVSAPMPGGSALGMASHVGLPPPTPIAPKPISLFQALDH